MWLRTALILVLALLAWKFVAGLARALVAPSERDDRAPGPRPRPAGPEGSGPSPPRNWPPSDVVDVPYRDATDDRAASP